MHSKYVRMTTEDDSTSSSWDRCWFSMYSLHFSYILMSYKSHSVFYSSTVNAGFLITTFLLTYESITLASP